MSRINYPMTIDELISEFVKDENLQMATVATELFGEDEMENPNNVKVVIDKKIMRCIFRARWFPIRETWARRKFTSTLEFMRIAEIFC